MENLNQILQDPLLMDESSDENEKIDAMLDEIEQLCDHTTKTTQKGRAKKEPILAIDTRISSKLFENKFDQLQYQKIYKNIIRSPLIRKLEISNDIIQELAEFATGKLKQCHNRKCYEVVNVLQEDKKLYDPSNKTHDYSTKLLYKKCVYSESIYCFECMDKTVLAKCYCKCGKSRRSRREPIMRLELISNNSQCSACGTYFPASECYCWRSCDGEYCQDEKYFCIECVRSQFHECATCDYGGNEALCRLCHMCELCRDKDDSENETCSCSD